MIGKTLDGRYELVEFIGKGGTALVYRALDHRTGHWVAVKILRPELREDEEFSQRFEREALAASRVSHHNIVNLLDVCKDGDCQYLVMEYVPGRTLEDVISQKGALPPQTAAQITLRVLSALQHAHNNGIIHRDIKSQNILVHSEGLIKVADFGIARVAGSHTLTKTDTVMGSVHYFSPEQAKGEDVTYASDLYSVGVVMYEMLTGRLPFDGETPVSVAMQHISAEPEPIGNLKPNVPPAIIRVVEKAMKKSLAERYQSATEMARDLQQALNHPDELPAENTQEKQPVRHQKATPGSKPVKPVKAPFKWSRQIKWAAVTLASLAVIFVLYESMHLIFDRVLNFTEAPYLLDETEDSALRLISRAELKYELSRISDEVKPAGTVIMQSPEYGTAMKKNETLYLTVSTGPAEQAVPRIIGMAANAARQELEKYGFTLLVLPARELSPEPWDTVVMQDPAPEEMMPSGSVIQVRLSGGSVTLPNLVDMNRNDAMLLIQQLKLNLTEIKEIPIDDLTQADKVAAQQFSDGDMNTYAPGDQVMQQTQVTLAIYVMNPDSLPATEAPDAQNDVPEETQAAQP